MILMNIVYFLTYDYSFKLWDETGNISREKEYFDQIYTKNKDYNFTFITYGDQKDLKYETYFNNCKIIPIYQYTKFRTNKIARLLTSFSLPFKINKLLKDEKIDLIKQNQLQGVWVSLIFKFLTKKPLILRSGYDVLSFKLKEKKAFYKIIFYYFITQFALIFSNIYTVTSKADADFLKKYFLLNKNKLRIRPNFVTISNKTPFLNRQEKKILMVGRLEKQKNYEFILKEFKNSDFTIEIYGEGSDMDYLKILSDKYKTDVVFKKIIPNSEMENLLNKYKFFISCSKFEGNPKSVLEAMGAGCIVFVSSNKNTQEIITNNKNGFLFDLESDNFIELFNSTISRLDLENISNFASSYIKQSNSLDTLVQEELEDIATLMS